MNLSIQWKHASSFYNDYALTRHHSIVPHIFMQKTAIYAKAAVAYYTFETWHFNDNSDENTQL